jgi:polar amino acid transport system permease protein
MTNPPDQPFLRRTFSGSVSEVVNRLRSRNVPWWALVAILLGVWFSYTILTDPEYNDIFRYVIQGLLVTVRVTLIAYVASLVLGLIIALARVSSNVVINQIAAFYVEILRGVPMLVVLLYVFFVGATAIVDAVHALGFILLNVYFPPLDLTNIPTNTQVLMASLHAPGSVLAQVARDIGTLLADFSIRSIQFEFRVILALTLAYSAFMSEIFRAGIESIDRGQMEAARAMGMTYWQAMRYVILPQAIRNVLPPLGNDFIAMLKDSSLVSFVGVQDITKRGNEVIGSKALVFETYNVVAFVYLVMTLLLSLLVRWLEKRTTRDRRR